MFAGCRDRAAWRQRVLLLQEMLLPLMTHFQARRKEGVNRVGLGEGGRREEEEEAL